MHQTNATAQSLVHRVPRPLSGAISVRRPRIGPWLQIFTPAGFEWNHAELPIPDLPEPLDGLRILHVTDLHMRSRWTRAYDELIDRLRADPPDLVINTGDYVDSKRDHRPALPNVRRFLTSVSARLGHFGVVGNHDGDLLAPRLSGWNIHLIGGRATLHVHGATIELIGLAGADRDDYDRDFVQTLAPKTGNTLRLVLSHYPDAIAHLPHLGGDVFFTGHTHGGQICLPNGFAPIRHDSLPRELLYGIHRVHDTWLIANRGFGFSGLPVRAFCPAEVIELKLVREAMNHNRVAPTAGAV